MNILKFIKNHPKKLILGFYAGIYFFDLINMHFFEKNDFTFLEKQKVALITAYTMPLSLFYKFNELLDYVYNLPLKLFYYFQNEDFMNKLKTYVDSDLN